ncbi:MAG: type II toxin-antitoxin system HigB family toxin [Chloroflexota bacterium]|nr:type II toxin-antitoxin system HigB family toxin [Chloroflexota bacterium]
MRIIAKRTLREYWERHADAEQSLRAWHEEAKQAHWGTPEQVKQRYPKASIIANNRVVFNIKGNVYRLVVHIRYDHGSVYIRFIGTHTEYDRIDSGTV